MQERTDFERLEARAQQEAEAEEEATSARKSGVSGRRKRGLDKVLERFHMEQVQPCLPVFALQAPSAQASGEHPFPQTPPPSSQHHDALLAP